MSLAVRHALPLLLVAALTAGGCAVSTPHTSRQLQHGDVVWSAGADVPGLLVIPNLRAQAQVGVAGWGDLSAHLGLIPLPVEGLPVHAGAGLRAYPTRWMTLSADGDLLFFVGAFDEARVLTTTWRATSTTGGARRLYGGLHLVTAWLLDGEGFSGGNLGGVIGWESKPNVRGNTWQIELSLAPWMVSQSGRWAFLNDPATTEDGAPFVGQLSFSYHFMDAAYPRPTPASAQTGTGEAP